MLFAKIKHNHREDSLRNIRSHLRDIKTVFSKLVKEVKDIVNSYQSSLVLQTIIQKYFTHCPAIMFVTSYVVYIMFPFSPVTPGLVKSHKHAYEHVPTSPDPIAQISMSALRCCTEVWTATSTIYTTCHCLSCFTK